MADGNDLGNGDNFGGDMLSWGYKLLNHETGHAVSLTEGYNAGRAARSATWASGT